MFENPSSLPANPLPPTPGTPPVKSTSSVPANLPSAPVSEPEDMFGKTESMPKPSGAPGMPKMPMSEGSQSPAVDPPLVTNRKSILVASLVLGVIILIGGGVLLAKFLGGSVTQLDSLRGNTPTDTNSATPPLTENPLAPSDSTTTPSDQNITTAPSLAPKDTDGDGLNDDEEQILATSITLPDTDKDGLSDYDEVRVYQTDPLKDDPDGDTYKDGEEVKNGYNPAGPGKIFGAPSSPSASTGASGSATATTPTKPPLTESPLSPRQ